MGLCNSIYSICPNTNPALVGLNTVYSTASELGLDFSTCSTYLSEFDCVKDLGFPQVAGGKFLGPNDLPPNGTEKLSNVAGTVTAPASGTLFSYTNGADSVVYTITAASTNGKNVAATTAATTSADSKGGSSQATVGSASAGSGSPSSTGSGAQATKASQGEKLSFDYKGLFSLSLCLALLTLF